MVIKNESQSQFDNKKINSLAEIDIEMKAKFINVKFKNQNLKKNLIKFAKKK